MKMEKLYIIEIPAMCECGYPGWDTYGIYASREEAEKDLKVLCRKAELNGEDKPKLREKTFDTPSLDMNMPKLARVSVLTDEEEKIAHIGRPYASVQDSGSPEEDYWTDSTESYTSTLVKGGYMRFESERTLYLTISDDDTRESLKQRAEEFVKKEGYEIV